MLIKRNLRIANKMWWLTSQRSFDVMVEYVADKFMYDLAEFV